MPDTDPTIPIPAHRGVDAGGPTARPFDLPVMVSTETTGGRLARALWRVLVGVACGGLASAAVLLGSDGPSGDGLWAALACGLVASVGAWAFVVPGAAHRVETRGHWRADDRGFVHQPLDDAERRVAWEAVRRVRWSPHVLRLEGSAGTIAVGGPLLDHDAQAALRRAVRAGLGPAWDLPADPAPASRLGRLLNSPRARWLGATIGWTAAWSAAPAVTLAGEPHWIGWSLLAAPVLALSAALPWTGRPTVLEPPDARPSDGPPSDWPPSNCPPSDCPPSNWGDAPLVA